LREEIDSLKDQLKHEQLKNSFAGENQSNPSYRAPLQMIDLDQPKQKRLPTMLTVPDNMPTNLSHGDSERPKSLCLSDSFALEIDEKLQEAVAERESLEAEILHNEEKVNTNNISLCQADPLSGTAFLEKL